jgi:hypothetical protein
MNGKCMCVKNQSKNGECMHMKCKSIVTVEWNNLVGIKFISTIWWPLCANVFSIFIIIMNKFFYNFCCYTVDEGVYMNDFF